MNKERGAGISSGCKFSPAVSEVEGISVMESASVRWEFGVLILEESDGVWRLMTMLNCGATKLKRMHYKLGIGRGEVTINFHWLFRLF